MNYLIKILAGVLILFGAYKNLYPVEWVEFRLVEQHLANWYTAPLSARMLVGLKLIIGAFMILNINPKNILPKGLLLLIVLHIYDLLWQQFTKEIVMDVGYSSILGRSVIPAAINVLFFAFVVLYMWRQQTSDLKIKWLKYIFIIILFALPFILNPVYPQDFKDMSKPANEVFDSASVVPPEFKKLSEQGVLVAFFSTDCQFCLNAARKISIAQNQCANFPEIMVCMLGEEKNARTFFDKANAPFQYFCMSAEDFSILSSFRFPQFVWVENGRITRKWTGQTFNYHTMSSFCSR